jgi:serpin B
MIDYPYWGSSLWMTFLLPAAGEFEATRSGLTQAWFEQARASMGSATVRLTLPKFQLDWRGYLEPALRALGLTEAFQPTADFSGLASGEVLLEDVVHQATLGVDEVGTEAAAGTALVTRSSEPRDRSWRSG